MVNLGDLFADSQKLDFNFLYTFSRPPPFTEKQTDIIHHRLTQRPLFPITVIIIIAYNEDIFVNVDCANIVKVVLSFGTSRPDSFAFKPLIHSCRCSDICILKCLFIKGVTLDLKSQQK